MLGKLPTHWRDEDRSHFRNIASKVCHSYQASLDLALTTAAEDGQLVRMVRLSVLDTQGQQNNHVAVLPEDKAKQYEAFAVKAAELAESMGLDPTDAASVFAVSLFGDIAEEQSEEVGS